MTDERSTTETPEDAAILQALRGFDALTSEDLGERLRESDEVSDALLQQYTEVFAAVAWSAEPVAPSPTLRDAIRFSLAGDETQRIDPVQVAIPAVARGASDRRPAPSAPPVPSRASYWLAAVLALVAVGLAVGTFWLSGQLEAQRARLAAQEVRLQELDQRLEEARTEQEAAARSERSTLIEIQDRFHLVTAAGTEICPMKPPAGSPQPRAVGVLYVAEDHQHWYLKAEGLEPPGEERVFQLWFVSGPDRTPVSAGTFRVEAGEVVHLGSPTMPEGTTAALVTVEPPEGRDRPTGPVVLYGDEVMRIL